MKGTKADAWLARVRATTTFVYVAALCLAVAVLVIDLVPGSPATFEVPTSLVPGAGSAVGLAHGVVLDPAGWIVLRLTDPSLGQRLLFAATVVPGLLLVAEIARRLRSVLRAAEATDPFTAKTAHALSVVARITAFGGLAVWAVAAAANSALVTTVLGSGSHVGPRWTPVWWLGVGFIVAAFGQLIARGVGMRAELDTVI
jgi:hypothetical protein